MKNKVSIATESEHYKLCQKYPWLRITTTVEKYIEPQYYDHLLKDYVFGGKTDLSIFNDFLKKIKLSQNSTVLELGCGSGRVTKLLMKKNKSTPRSMELVDLSGRMLNFCKALFKKSTFKLRFINSDSIAYLRKTKKNYDLIFSLWSFSHSTHQVLTDMGLKRGKQYIKDVFKKMVDKNMKKGSSFFIIHFDSLSDEQRILIKQWKRVFPIFKNNKAQSPSKLIMDEVFEKLKNQGLIDFKRTYLIGKSIIYKSMDEALEVFLNFHMESYFNESPHLSEIIIDLKKYFHKYQKKDGTIHIKPGCFIYVITKK